jgi:transcriptional regulator with XRE-family HTH domain
MNTVEKVKAICKERKIPISRLEKACGFANGYIGQLKKGSIPDDRLMKIAAFLSVPVEYLATGTVSSMDSDAAKIAQYVLDNNTVRLIVENIKELDEKERAWVLDAVRIINKKKH